MRRAMACIVAVALAGCGDRLPGRPAEPAPETPVQSFERLYAGNCAGCHGDKGRLGAAPPLNDPLFLAIVPEATLAKVIRDGRDGTLMPAFARAKNGALAPEEVEQLARGLKTFWKSAKASAGAPAYAATGGGDASAGAKAFARACAGCHGEDGRGGESAGSIRDPAFLGLLSDQALRRLVITGRPDLGMPDYAESKGREKGFRPLSGREVTDLVALLASWRQSDSERGK